MRIILSIAILSLVNIVLTAQVENNNIQSLPRVWSIDTINNGGELDLKLSPISKEKYEAYKKDASTVVEYKNRVNENSPIIHTQNSEFDLKHSENSFTPYAYGGFNSFIQCHLVYYCKEICEEFFMDHFTDQMFFIPTAYDQGVLGMPFSPQGSKWLVYSSYDGPDFDDYYDHRAEIVFYQITPNLGVKGIKYFGDFNTDRWSIEEVLWISEDSIVLKLYDEPRYGDGSSLNFSYFVSRLSL